MSLLKSFVFFVFIAFVAYTIYCLRTESFSSSIKKILGLNWGRQITIDLYLGLLLFNSVVYLIEGDFLVVLAWLVPSLLLGNIVPLGYFIWNFEKLISFFG